MHFSHPSPSSCASMRALRCFFFLRGLRAATTHNLCSFNPADASCAWHVAHAKLRRSTAFNTHVPTAAAESNVHEGCYAWCCIVGFHHNRLSESKSKTKCTFMSSR